jgi:hypothetical protein
MCVGSRVHLVGVSISFEKNFYRLPFTPPSLVRRIGPSGVDDDLGEKFIEQQQHQEHRGHHQGEGGNNIAEGFGI